MFNLDGTMKRERKTPCKQCGAMRECDDCWEHVRDWSPFVVWHCLLCRMPKATFDGGLSPVRCDYCGWDEATETETVTYEG